MGWLQLVLILVAILAVAAYLLVRHAEKKRKDREDLQNRVLNSEGAQDLELEKVRALYALQNELRGIHFWVGCIGVVFLIALISTAVTLLLHILFGVEALTIM